MSLEYKRLARRDQRIQALERAALVKGAKRDDELAAELDIKIGEMRAAFGEIGDSRLTVMACITYMDEREDLKKRVTALEEELAALKISYKSVETSVAQTEKEIADAIITAAGRIEEVAKSLASGEIS